jgi:hypothetical protein
LARNTQDSRCVHQGKYRYKTALNKYDLIMVLIERENLYNESDDADLENDIVKIRLR